MSAPLAGAALAGADDSGAQCAGSGQRTGSDTGPSLSASLDCQGTAGTPPVPALSIDDAQTVEGNDGSHDLIFKVKLSHPVAYPVSARFATADGSATAADGDYEAVQGIVSLLAGATEASIEVAVNGDTKEEADEAFTVDLSSPQPVGVTVADGQATGTVTDDDSPAGGGDGGGTGGGGTGTGSGDTGTGSGTGSGTDTGTGTGTGDTSGGGSTSGGDHGTSGHNEGPGESGETTSGAGQGSDSATGTAAGSATAGTAGGSPTGSGSTATGSVRQPTTGTTQSTGGSAQQNAGARCVVPRVRGRTQRKAVRMLHRRNCGVRKKRIRRHSVKVKRGRVVGTLARPGRRLRPRARVTLIVSKGRRARHHGRR